MRIVPTFSLRRKLPLSSKIFLSVAAACGLASFLLVRADASGASGQRAVAGPGVGVTVATHDIEAGATLTAADLRLTQMPPAFAPPGSIISPGAAVGLVAQNSIAEGEALSLSRLGRSVLAGSVGPGRLVVTAGFASVPQGLTTADRVDVFATFGGARPFTELVGEDLRVLRIDATSDALSDTGTAVTLDVDAGTARQLLQADATGTLALVARGMATATSSPSLSSGGTAGPG
ncbi:MAG: Flp pilus assembly protein CpaB [Actinobacteria bacterium]|nr:MAG: Flp pilus assembly protein CpaB [Actinomycetota bacterium]TMK21075.1 MAG: Flp pilus assembly protein CpaB [Actinomycetota bacterium]TMK95255.1 MAG: Flp pilus assembly protein CpaB [Actinomycetota bacterium]TMM25918.1 MAG: Flp pilus assembly protein CpaB [Actinomycetota bacterium]